MERDQAVYMYLDASQHAESNLHTEWGLDRIDQRELPLDGVFDVEGDFNDYMVFRFCFLGFCFVFVFGGMWRLEFICNGLNQT